MNEGTGEEDVQQRAKHWLARAPLLARYVARSPLKTELTEEFPRHPLFDWLSAPPGYLEAELYFDAINGALGAGISGDLKSRARRLAGSDSADYWSSLVELYVAAALKECGFDVALGSPDVSVTFRGDGSQLGLELNCIRQTVDASRLHDVVAHDWTGKCQPNLRIPDERVRIPLRQARAIRDEMLRADARMPLLGKDGEVEVDLTSTIDPSKVRAYLTGGSPGYCVTTSGAQGRLPDPWPEIDARVQEKRGQLSRVPCGLVGLEMAHGHRSGYMWADRLKSLDTRPTLETAANIAGVIVFWTDIRRHKPFKSHFIRNSLWPGPDPEALSRVLDCLGSTAL